MKKSILLTAAMAAALMCVTCYDNSGNSPGGDDGADSFANKFHRGDNPPADSCAANPTAYGCPGYCPPTQLGCPGYTPTPTPATYTLTVGRNDASGGSVSRNPSKSAYNAGDTVTVTAAPNSGYGFTGWTGSLTSAEKQVRIRMDADKNLTANFVWQDTTPPPPAVITYTLTVNASPASGGSVSLSPDLTDYEDGATVTATVTAYSGYRFTGWSGASTVTTNPVTITMNSNKTLTAMFELIPATTYAVTVTNGTGGGNYAAGAAVSITAGAAPAGQQFKNWTSSPAVTFANANNAITTFTMPSSAVSVTANYEAIPPVTNPCATNPNAAGCNNPSLITVANLWDSMVSVEGGTLTLGCTSSNGCNFDATPAYTAALSSFYLSKYEVTQGLWKEVMGSNNNPSEFTGNDNLPVSGVSWSSTQSFISALNTKTGKNYRLPTEEEWEFAARGGQNSSGYKYSGGNTINSVAWYKGNSDNTIHPVGGKQPNELGLYDMTGNVWEWVDVDGTGLWFRGCSWDNVLSNNYNEDECLVSIRYQCNPCAFGIRLALSSATNPCATNQYASATCPACAVASPPTQCPNYVAPATYTLTVARSPAAGGSVSVTVGTGSAQTNPAVQTVASGASVTVAATPASGYTFNGWTGDASGTTNPVTITMNGSKTLTANFQQQAVPTCNELIKDTRFASVEKSKWTNGTTDRYTRYNSDGWTTDFWAHEDTKATFSVSGVEMTVNVTYVNSVQPDYQVTLHYFPISLVYGKIYTISFEASTTRSGGKYIKVQSQDPNIDGVEWLQYGEEEFALTSTLAKYSFDVTMSSSSNTKTSLQFNFGGSTGTVRIRNVSVTESGCK